MRCPLRQMVVIAAGCVWLALAAPTGGAQAPPAAQPAAQAVTTVRALPGAVPLIRDEPDTTSLPRHFRTMADPFPPGAQLPLPSRAGLDELRASGSAQF